MKRYIIFSSTFFLICLFTLQISNLSAQAITNKGFPSLQGRPTDLQACINVHDTILTIYYWDCAIEDNDTVSLNLNGVWILQKVRLANAKQSIQIKVKPGENFLTLYAHNLGDIPNNTAAASIHEQYAKQDINLSSSLEKCGTARIACYIGSPAALMATLAPCVKKELSTAAADDAKHEIEVREAQIAAANSAKNTPSSGTQPRPRRQRNSAPYPRTTIITGPVIIPSGNHKTSPSPSPAPAPRQSPTPAPRPATQPIPR